MDTARSLLHKPEPHTTAVFEMQDNLPWGPWWQARCQDCDWKSTETTKSKTAAARYGLLHEDDVIVNAIIEPISEAYNVPDRQALRAAFFEGRNFGRTDI